MDIVEFVESALNVKLMEYQKEFLKTCYEKYADNKEIHYIPARGQSRLNLMFLQYIAIVIAESNKIVDKE